MDMTNLSPETPELQRANLAMSYCATARPEKPIHELLREVVRLGESRVSKLLWCYPEFVASWFPKKLPNGQMCAGVEPSAGFIGAALVILRNN